METIIDAVMKEQKSNSRKRTNSHGDKGPSFTPKSKNNQLKDSRNNVSNYKTKGVAKQNNIPSDKQRKGIGGGDMKKSSESTKDKTSHMDTSRTLEIESSLSSITKINTTALNVPVINDIRKRKSLDSWSTSSNIKGTFMLQVALKYVYF